MKRLLLLITLIGTFAFNGYSQLVKVTATQRAGYTIDTTDFWLNPANIWYVKNATAPLIAYSDAPKADTFILYKVTDKFDSIVNRCNRASANIVKLWNVTMVSGTSRDTLITWGYPLNKFVEVKAKTVSSMPKVNTTISSHYKNKAGYIRWDIGETPAVIKTRIDSLLIKARVNGI